jgi:hypothetical protein
VSVLHWICVYVYVCMLCERVERVDMCACEWMYEMEKKTYHVSLPGHAPSPWP